MSIAAVIPGEAMVFDCFVIGMGSCVFGVVLVLMPFGVSIIEGNGLGENWNQVRLKGCSLSETIQY